MKKTCNPRTQMKDSDENNYSTQLGIVEVHCGGGEQSRAKTNFHCSNADGWTKGTLFYPINFLFLDPPNY